MDYEKAYNEALGWMRKIYPTLTGTNKEDAEHYFPELKESEDEMIRKEIIEFINWSDSYGAMRADFHQKNCPERWIAYLEKQKEYLDDIRQYAYNKGLVDAKQKSAEWSEEDEKMLTGIIERGSSQIPSHEPALREEQMEWLMKRLKSLRPQPHWKPSKEQMCALKYASTYVPDDEGTLAELYEQLKKITSFQQDQMESELEKAARYVYESWMGGTMDDVRRDMVELGKALNARGIKYE